MSDDTDIGWTHVPHPCGGKYRGATWNPVRGCKKISPGCKHCYAETFAERWRGVAGHPYEQGFDLRLVPHKLDEPLRKREPRAYFVNSMSDLHQDDVPSYFVRQVYAVMDSASRHLFMVLTKRADNMRVAIRDMRSDASLFADHRDGEDASLPISDDHQYVPHPYMDGPPRNVWLGVSVEDRKYGLPRVDVLRQIPAAVRFLSIEPLLEDLGQIDFTGIDWVIVGGESGSLLRPCKVEWIESIAAQCIAAGVPVFVKQDSHRKPGQRGRLPDHLWSLKQFPEVRRAS